MVIGRLATSIRQRISLACRHRELRRAGGLLRPAPWRAADGRLRGPAAARGVVAGHGGRDGDRTPASFVGSARRCRCRAGTSLGTPFDSIGSGLPGRGRTAGTCRWRCESKPASFWLSCWGWVPSQAAPGSARGRLAISDKVKPQHLTREAVLSVRRPSPHPALHGQESRSLSYAMKDRLRHLGWNGIDVVDGRLGRPAAGAVMQSDFARMVADVSLGRVGAVAAREVSRFARNSRDWQQLVEMCRVVDTLMDGAAIALAFEQVLELGPARQVLPWCWSMISSCRHARRTAVWC